MTLSSTVKSKGKDIKSEIRAKLSNLPIGGTIDAGFSAEMKSSRYEFSSEIIAHGQSARDRLLSTTDYTKQLNLRIKHHLHELKKLLASLLGFLKDWCEEKRIEEIKSGEWDVE
jgi:hypothetical protein